MQEKSLVKYLKLWNAESHSSHAGVEENAAIKKLPWFAAICGFVAIAHRQVTIQKL